MNYAILASKDQLIKNIIVTLKVEILTFTVLKWYSPLWKFYLSLLFQNSCELRVLYLSLQKLLLHQAGGAPECSHAKAVPICAGPLNDWDPQSAGINLETMPFQIRIGMPYMRSEFTNNKFHLWNATQFRYTILTSILFFQMSFAE